MDLRVELAGCATSQEHEKVSGSVRSYRNGIHRKAFPFSRYAVFLDDVPCRAARCLLICCIKHREHLPIVTRCSELPAVPRHQALTVFVWKSHAELALRGSNVGISGRKGQGILSKPHSGARYKYIRQSRPLKRSTSHCGGESCTQLTTT